MSQIPVLIFILYFTLGVISFIAFMKSLRLGVDLWNKKKNNINSQAVLYRILGEITSYLPSDHCLKLHFEVQFLFVLV